MAGQALGSGMQLAGTFMAASAAKRRKKKLEQIAQTPGVDFGAAAGDVVSAGKKNLPGALDFTSGVNLGAQKDIEDVLNKAIPGYSPMQATRAGQVSSFLRGEIPADVAKAVTRNAAGHALEGGFAGTPAGRNLEARDLGLTSLDLIGKGMSGMSDMVRTTPLPRFMQANDILNLTETGGVGVRSDERKQKLEMLLGAANAPTSSDVWAKGLQDMGSSMASSGAGGGGGLGGIMGLVGSI